VKRKPLPFFSYGKSILPFCFFLLFSFFTYGQSETHDFVTYDTTISYSCNTGVGGCLRNGVLQAFRLRISRPRNYFTPGNADTASRPWFVTMPGKGEVGPDTNKLVAYGPHYWLNNGWDGGVQLENGKHYPILITIMGDTVNVTAPFVQALMDTLYKYFHPKPNSIHMAGLSMGVQVLTNYLGYEKVAGDEHNMARVKSFVDLQGEGPDGIGADPMAYPTFFGHWAKKYGGRFFGLEGDDDSRNIWQITELMNDSVANSAYFAYEHVGGTLNHGEHCCWNSMYDPSVTNWIDSPNANITNPNIDPKYAPHPNTLGTYVFDPATGSNIFQWMLRQGDTSLVGGSAPPPNIPPVAHAGPDTTITLPADSVVVTGSGTDADGTITAYAWTKLSGTGGTITAPSSATTTFKSLTAGVYRFVLTVTDNNGATGKDTMQVTVDTAVVTPPTGGLAETHDFITYDTTINYSCNTGADGCAVGGVVQVFSLRISRPRNYFTAGSPDTASRPWFVTMQSEYEVGTDTNKLVTYGPHYWLKNGWDGGVTLNNGKHYPILITIMGQQTNVTAPFVQALMDTLYKYFHPKPNSVHMAGVSMGVQVLTNYLGYEKIAGDEHNMSSVKSFVDLQGLGPDGIGADPMTYPTFFGYWARKYGGRFFGLEGDNDSRNIWQITELMNDSVPHSAYFAYEHVGGPINQGNHCCWNGMYDPSVTNWVDSPDSKITNPNIDPRYYLHPNTLGTYTVDPVTGTNIFQWMLRQGDTTLVGGGTPVNPPPPATTPLTFVAPGEYQVFFIDSTKHLYGVGTNLNTLGVGGAGVPGTTLAVAVPSNLKFKTAAGILHGGAAVDTAGNVWSWGDNDQGQVGNGSVSSGVLTPVQVATDSMGNPFTGITTLVSYYTGNTSQGWYAVKSDSTLWVWGQTFDGMRGNGTAGSTANTRPVQVPLPGGRKVMKIVAGDNLIVLFSDSTVWTCGGSGGNLGYTVSGNSYQSLQQLTTLTGIKDIAGGGLFNYALKSNGTLYGWGYYGYYMGGTGSENSPLATPTDLTTRLSLPHPIRSIAVNMNCTHVILSDSTLWGWGDNAQGGIGIGQELDFSTTPDPYAWSYAPAQLLQRSPVQVTSRKDFVALFSNYNFVMYTYAETAGGQLYSWGRNKGAVLGNGIVGCTSDIVATYPNSWDITTPAAVNPLSITSTTVGPCPYCVAHPTTSPCNTCTTGSATKPAAATGTGVKLDNTGAVPEQLLLYPTVTHANETLTMALSSISLGPVSIRIMDMNGRVVKTLQTEKQSAYLNQVLSTGHLTTGMYMVQVMIGNDKQFMAKFIRE